MKKKGLAAVLGLIMLAGALMGCSGGGKEATGEEEGKSGCRKHGKGEF